MSPANKAAIRALRQQRPWEIASALTLVEAARLSSLSRVHMYPRMALAWHEAAHIVTAASFGYATLYCQIPQVTGSDPSASVQLRQLPDTESDILSDLELAVIYAAGDVAVGVTDLGQPEPVRPSVETDCETPDTLSTRWRVRKCLSEIDALAGDPSAEAYIAEWTAAHPHASQRLPSRDELHTEWVDGCIPRAMAVVAENFGLIDAVATVLLVTTTGRNDRIPYELMEWIAQQAVIPAWVQWSAGRECGYPVPDWLCQQPDKPLRSLRAIRFKLDELRRVVPARDEIAEMVAGMDFSSP